MVEATMAMALVVTVVGSVAAALLAGRAIAGREREESIGRAAAQARLASLTSLAFHTGVAADGSPVAISDTTTDVAMDPPGPGGSGLRVSPVDALWIDRTGYVDYLDATGDPIGSGAAARDRAAFVRRWAIGRQGSGRGEVAALAVLVAPMAAAARAAASDPARLAVEPGVVLRRAARMREAS